MIRSQFRVIINLINKLYSIFFWGIKSKPIGAAVARKV